MTDRIHGFVVTLDRDIREDDVEPILDAIRMIKHVADVQPLVAELSDHLARSRVRHDIAERLLRAIHEIVLSDKSEKGA